MDPVTLIAVGTVLIVVQAVVGILKTLFVFGSISGYLKNEAKKAEEKKTDEERQELTQAFTRILTNAAAKRN